VGGGGCYCYGPEDLFNKNVVTKAYWKWPFLWKPLKQKKSVKSFARHFWFLIIFCLRHPGLIFIFTKKGFLNIQAVRIRVKKRKYLLKVLKIDYL
jgi:hypothetical protein